MNNYISLEIMLKVAKNKINTESMLLDLMNINKKDFDININNLESNEFIQINKECIDNILVTNYFCTEKGNLAVNNYLKLFKSLLKYSFPTKSDVEIETLINI